MREILKSTNAVLISFAEATLAAEGIDIVVADRFISALEGAIGAFPQRILVAADDWDAARAALVAAGLGGDLAETGP